ncbi:flavodoxin family protein [Paraburkholderia sp. BL25I1N1]|uniref:flavodoxin family protein n=1 Tax=Paraburkholderia sp. BL25I1N1 TaxID=1938804 RepID=UPI000D082ACB|nr:flavodoxin family protein [Paraburkholderia sp. BL25I1N1]PRY04479.1 NAD(P)H dehydrogenase (quinone) [Paraburkholderia sp. BL25I1N1]
MITIAIVYSSGHGHTRTVAEHIQVGANGFPDTRADLIEIKSNQIALDGRWKDDDIMRTLSAADAIVFGAPTFMGSAHGLFKLFLETGFTPWLTQDWKDKIAAGFTNSASRSGDKLIAIEQMAVFAAQMSMVWVGVGDQPGGNFSDSRSTDVNVNGSWLGLMTQSVADGNAETAPHPGDRLTAERFGRRIARTTSRWMLGADTFPPQPISESEAHRRNVAGPQEWHKFED